MSVVACVIKHLGRNSPIGTYKAEMTEDVAELEAGGMSKEAAWLQVIDDKSTNLKAERARIEQSVADAYAKTAAGKAAAAGPLPTVYKTREGAQRASKESGNTKRVKEIAGGFILREATDKELAAAGAASKRGRSMTGGGPGLLAQIARRGGIDRQSAARDLGVNKDDFNRPSGIFGRPVFSASAGKSAEHMLESLIEDKYLLDGATLRDLEDAIGDALNGRAVLALDHDYSDGMAARQAEIEANFYAEDDPLADLTSDDLQDIGYIGASAEAQQASEELIAAAEALGIDVDTIRENADSETRGQTDDQYQAAVQRLAREAIASAGQNAQGADASAAGAGNQDRGQSTGDQGQEESSAANRLARIGASVDAVARQWQRDNNPLEASILDAWDLNIGAASNEQIEDAIVALGKLRKALGDGKATTKARIDARVQELRAGQGAEEGLTLEAQTPADLREKAEREAAAADDDKKEQARIKREDDKARERRELGDRTRQDASADGFELGQSRADVIKAMSGMGDMFADAPAAQAAAILDAAPDPFADNYAALNGKTITQQVLVADTGKTATLRMDAGQALRDVNERETALVKLKACIGR